MSAGTDKNTVDHDRQTPTSQNAGVCFFPPRNIYRSETIHSEKIINRYEKAKKCI